MLAQRDAGGFTLLEAMVALSIVALVVTTYLGIRTAALIDGIEARNWRLARELAEEKMSELLAGAREMRAESGVSVEFDKYKGFSYKVLIGESAVADLDVELTGGTGVEPTDARERAEWQRNRQAFAKASARGLSYLEYQEQMAQQEYQRQLEDKVPSETEFEEVAVVVYFPKTNPEYQGQQESFVIKARASTLALSGLTPEQADQVAQAKGQSTNDPAVAGTGR